MLDGIFFSFSSWGGDSVEFLDSFFFFFAVFVANCIRCCKLLYSWIIKVK